MRRLVVALIVAAVVAILSGCGGGGAKSTSATSEPNAPVTAPVAASAAAAAQGQGWSSNEPPVFTPFPVNNPAVPASAQQQVAGKQPTLFYFYNSAQYASHADRTLIDSVLDDNRGLVDLMAYDLGDHFTTTANGTVKTESSFEKDTQYQAATNFANALGVTFTPYLVLTDNQGYIIWRFRGLADKAFLEREVLRASN